MTLESLDGDELEANGAAKLWRLHDDPLAGKLVTDVEVPPALVAVRTSKVVVAESSLVRETLAALPTDVLKLV